MKSLYCSSQLCVFLTLIACLYVHTDAGELPKPEPANEAPIPIGPRGKYSAKTDAFEFKLQRFDLRQPVRGEELMTLYFEVVPAGNVKVALIGPMKLTAAEDELGTKLVEKKGPARPPFTEVHFTESRSTLHPAQLYLSMPSKRADRLVKLAGTYSVYVADESAEVDFDLPAGKQKLDAPISKGAVTLISVEYTDTTVCLKYTIPNDQLFRGPDGRRVAKAQLFTDLAGASIITQPTAIPDQLDGPLLVISETFKLIRWEPTKCTIRYVPKATLKEIPFEFKDVGLPRKLGMTQAKDLEAQAISAHSGIIQKPPKPGEQTIHVNQVEVETETSSAREGMIRLNLKVSFDALPKKPYGMTNDGRCIRAIDSAGPVKTEEYPFSNYATPRTSSAFRLTIPDYVKKLDELELAIPIVFSDETHTLSWKMDDPPTAQKYNGWDFNLLQFKNLGEKAEVEVEYTVPAQHAFLE